jgi:23S rRNA pseudouridine1911/1915/1917 synthase
MPALDILYQDNHLLVINKPAGIATMGAESGPTVHSLAAEYLKVSCGKPGRAYVGIVSRLDSLTSGVLVLARTSKAAARLSTQLAEKSGQAGAIKIYLAAVAGSLEPQSGEWIDYVAKDDAAHRVRVVSRASAGAQEARLRYVTLACQDEVSIVAVQLISGRKHQIRVQFSHRGQPVIGDRKYGSKCDFAAGIALHSWRLRILHPIGRQPIWFEAGRPASWRPWARILPTDRELRARLAKAFALPADACSMSDDCPARQPVFVPACIISGGQTGVDRAALDAAIAIGIGHGGWCPAGRLSEDGTVPSRYDLRETESSEYPVRTEQNVIDSDATLILYEDRLKGGTLLTRRICRRLAKPHLVVRIDRDDPGGTRHWLAEQRPATLNVAGPRESTAPGIFQRSLVFLLRVLDNRPGN